MIFIRIGIVLIAIGFGTAILGLFFDAQPFLTSIYWYSFVIGMFLVVIDGVLLVG